jgi:hypothetical protein
MRATGFIPVDVLKTTGINPIVFGAAIAKFLSAASF